MPVPTTIIGRGARGDLVERLQERLKALGFVVGPTDGDFGRNTDAAVVSFQQAHGLRADGIVGPKTWTELYEGTAAAHEAPPAVVVPPDATPGARAVLEAAIKELGVREEPDGSNDGPRVRVYTGNWPVPWCALWLDFILGSVNRRPWPKRMARVVSIRDWARERGRLVEGPEALTYRPKPGDGFLQLTEGQPGVDPSHGHVGFVLRREGSGIVTLEGNSGNAVRSRTRPLSSIDAFVRFDHASS